jgi:hypothetical protein
MSDETIHFPVTNTRMEVLESPITENGRRLRIRFALGRTRSSPGHTRSACGSRD